jgi:CubicO group peptidase (beta-lactamase class C family)
MTIMQGFPPAEPDRATLANWRTQPWSSWAFHHVREIVPTAEIANDPARVVPLETGTLPLDDARINSALSQVNNDAFVVLHKGRLVHESYRNGMTAADPHILMSVSKSMLGLLAGALAASGALDLDKPLTHYVPELEQTAYAGATVRDALDMRVGVLFDEDYLVTHGPIVDYRRAANWNPGDTDLNLRSFQSLLTDRDGTHGGRFHYVSPVTDLLAWVFERATGTRYADLMSRHLWQPLGAERPAYITVDRIGGCRAAGGMCVTARDLARVGQMMATGGMANGTRVLPRDWLDDIIGNGSSDAWAKGDFVEKFPEGDDRHYRSKWYVRRGAQPLIHGLGIHGQYLFVDPARALSIAWLSSEPEPVGEMTLTHVLGAVAAVQDAADAA